MKGLGPVSSLLESQLRASVRRHGVVVWLDLDDQYSAFADRLQQLHREATLPYPVYGYRGSFLELLLALESETGAVDPMPLVIHVPGFSPETVHRTPLFELYKAGTQFQRAIETLVNQAATGKLPRETVAAFLAQGEITLDGADAWLSARLDAETHALAASLRSVSLNGLFDDLLGAGTLAAQVAEPGHHTALMTQLRAMLGMPVDWEERFLSQSSGKADEVAFVAAGWALCVEYVQDLKRPLVDGRLASALRLPAALATACTALCQHLRSSYPSFYISVADDTSGWLLDEAERAQPEDLGATETFRFEEEILLAGALDRLGSGHWQSVLDWAERRADGQRFWLRQDAARTSAWRLLQAVAQLGVAIETAGDRLGATDLPEAVQRYVEAGASADQAHRHLEQQRLALLYPQVQAFDRIRAQVDRVTGFWRTWADAWARDFSQLCRTEGFLPEPGIRQRTLFAEVVEPLLDGAGATALFLVDALRYEMAEELFGLLANTAGSQVRLAARLAELPTVTAVGMNVLAPVAGAHAGASSGPAAQQGRLRPAIADGRITGFSTGEFTVTDPETRRRAMQSRVGGTTLPSLTLNEVLQRDAASLRQAVSRARLVVVSSLEIDEAGEKGVGPAFFDPAIQRLRAAWRLLREAGVRRFVITADHGFLLVDPTRAAALAHGRKVDPKRRHLLSEQAADHAGEVRVPLSELGYEGTDLHLMMPETTAVFDTGKRGRGFVHGGNSLQERVIPVLTLVHRHPAGGDATAYRLSARRLDGVAGMHCIAAEVSPAGQGALDFGGRAEVELALRVPGVETAGSEAVGAETVRVDLCQVRGAAKLIGASLSVEVGRPFELFFRLSGAGETRVLVELFHPAAEVNLAPCLVDGRFAVTATRTEQPPITAMGTQERSGTAVSAASLASAGSKAWLERLADASIRQVFAHLDTHGLITETEVIGMLGGARAARRFAREVEQYALHAPFAVRIDVVGGVKRYVKEGGWHDDTDQG
ncbi:BREX-6 system phosphatase PglZ [Lamprobacter sp.]|uniref:BREX-6 system phosphatase PglZ n=1 Tax=Lamprobacter sp. TaxID=3100796 RepID=UPI002B261A52|nr:BREX-6 system phosphatase PglZ [Lamprobacter sp.]